MPLARFNPATPLQVTIRGNGRFSFNVAATAYLHQHGIRRLTLYGDPEDKTIQFVPAEPSDKASRLISYTFLDAPWPTRATLEAAPFLKWLGYHMDEPLRFTLRLQPCNVEPPQPLFEECLTFTATASSATPARIGRPPCD